MAEGVIQIRDLQFGYRVGMFRMAVERLHIAAQERVALIGPSGCGKTTLLNLLAGILVPSKGEIGVDGTCISALNQEDRQDFRALRMGLVFQEFELLEYLTVLDNVLLPFRLNPILQLTEAVRKRARALCDEVGLGDKIKRYPAHLSQGERQRVAVCRALVTEPKVILGDEPTGNLDPANRDLVMDILSEYSESSQAPLVMVTHDHELLDRFDRTMDIREVAA
ncbi:MAG: ABC transporter ATP-binding protein [Phycisphaerales bacterium]|nr:MAG: ABC transporter ATP-binding protein [Phycisphaerales bacterium]